MLNDLSAAKSGYAQAVGYFATSPSGQLGNADITASEQRIPKDTEVIVTISKGLFPVLSDMKDSMANSAKAIHEVHTALATADGLLHEMKDQVAQVKNYPPFPPGNEERIKYIKGIDGLRKELEALVVPQVADNYKPVFYPKESNLPALDAKTPSDAAVLAFGRAVEAIQVKVSASRVELQQQSDQLFGSVGNDLPQSQVQNISHAVAGQLSGISQSLVGSSDVLTQIGG